VKSQLPAAEWDFSILAQSSSDGLKLRQCFDWEYFREVYRQFPKFKQQIDDWRCDRIPDNGFYGQPDDPLHALGEGICTLWFAFCEDWPSKPFLESRIWTPANATPGAQQGHGLQLDLQELINFPPIGWDVEHWPAGSVLAAESDTIVALHINWNRPLKDIKEQFDQWLSWAHQHAASRPKRTGRGKANPVSQAQAALKALTALRLLQGRRFKEAADIYSKKVGKELYTDQAGWTNARKTAEQRIKKLGDEWG
jgi:hypothetical protein